MTTKPLVGSGSAPDGSTYATLTDGSGNLIVAGPPWNGPYPPGATPVTASATGTTGTVTATLPAVAGKTTYICGFCITADATAALAGAATVGGTISGSLNYIQNVGSATSAGSLTQTYSPAIPASVANTTITITSVAAGTNGSTAVAAWGYQL
jgi:hypothetical protein